MRNVRLRCRRTGSSSRSVPDDETTAGYWRCTRPGQGFFAQERELLEVYARYAASALDSATALIEAQQRYEQSSAFLALARALAVAGTSDEVARKLADAVPEVVDCDHVGVYLWDPSRGELARRAITSRIDDAGEAEPWSRAPTPGGPLERLLADPQSEPMFIDEHSGDPVMRELFANVGAVATIVVPLATSDSLLGLLAASVFDRRERLEPAADLLDRLSGVAAQATTALQNGRLVDQITYQARHDVLTGLANRLEFTDALRGAVEFGTPELARADPVLSRPRRVQARQRSVRT